MPYGNRKSGGKGYQSGSSKKTRTQTAAGNSAKLGQRQSYKQTGKAPGNGTSRKK